jgi:hypothetical protein
MTAPVGKAPSPSKTDREEVEQKIEDKFKAVDYSCEILLEDTTQEKAVDKKFPTDAFIVKYVVEGKERVDLTRSSKMVNVFDFYFDRFGKGAVQSIEFGYGSINPSQWGYKTPPKRKKRKG